MQQIFIELFNYKDAWRDASDADRNAYRQGVLGAIAKQVSEGVEIISWGFNDIETDRRAPYDFYCVYKTASAQYQRRFEAEIAAAGWYDYFDQANVSGALSTPETMFAALVKLEPAAREDRSD